MKDLDVKTKMLLVEENNYDGSLVNHVVLKTEYQKQV